MTGNELGDDAIHREHNGAEVGFCSEDCAAQWDAMTPEERDAKIADK